nr:RsmB/NOP family class I SAM-dependent RNA methyltransferase [Candidatus Omnitrophota bacterium]
MNKAFPSLFLERLRLILPPREQEAVLSSFSASPVLSVRVNTLKIDREACLAALRGLEVCFQEIPWWPLALIVDPDSRGLITASGYFDQGWLYRQSLASMLPVLALDPRPGERVLDMCAAPGGKTLIIAKRMQPGVKLVSNELSSERKGRLLRVLDE